MFKEKVGKEMAMHGGARLGVSLMLAHQARIIGAGEPAITINAQEQARAQEGTEVREEGGVLLRGGVLHGSVGREDAEWA
eukprot:8607158-Prorocentrum_lima.AAC.1